MLYKKISTLIAVLLFFVFHPEAATSGVVSERNEESAKTQFDPTLIIFDHINDAHGWHLWGHTSMSLPVILLTDKGMEIFLSSGFHHGEQDYRGKHYTYRLVDGRKIHAVDETGSIDLDATGKIWDFSITKNVVAIFISVAILLFIFISVARIYNQRAGKCPKGLQSFFEPVILFVRDEIVRPNIGAKCERFMPLLLTFFL